MGHDKGFPCHDITPLTSCRDTKIMSRQSVAKAGTRCVATGQHNERARQMNSIAINNSLKRQTSHSFPVATEGFLSRHDSYGFLL